MAFQSIYHLIRFIRNQWLNPSEIEEIQRRKLGAMMRHAYEQVDYYRHLFDSAGVKPEEIRDPSDLQKIPITTKSQLQRRAIAEITAKGLQMERCLQMKTSGSTGRPLDVLIDKDDSKIRGAIILRALLANGYRLKQRGVDIGSLPTYHRHHWYQYLGIARQKYILAFNGVDEQIDKMRKAKPDIIQAAPSTLRTIAEKMRQGETKAFCPRIIASGGEILTPQTREFINRTFGIEMVDFYSSWEFGNIAWECSRHAGYHMNADSLVVECIRNGKAASPGERGELVITSLHSHAMPFIRYDIGDVGVLGDKPCPCGRGLPLLEGIEGRRDDLLRLPGGRVVSPFTITAALRFLPGVVQFRLIQEKEDQFIVQLEGGKSFGQETVQTVRDELERILGTGVNLEVQILDEIPRDPSGKLRSVISKIAS